MKIASKVPCLEMLVFGSFLFGEQGAHFVGIYQIVSENLYKACVILPKKTFIFAYQSFQLRYVKRTRKHRNRVSEPH
jgi:hypothetical protein